MERWITQIRKGLVEYAVLLAVSHGETYGYQLQKALRASGAFTISESTLYPVLSRLRKEEAVTSRKVRSTSGPPRTYYKLSSQGRRRLQEMKVHWDEFHVALERLSASDLTPPES